MTIQALPTPTPSRNQSRAVFTAAMDAWMAYFPTFVEQFNDHVDFLNSLGVLGTPMSIDLSGTSDTDPGQGKIRLNNATQNAATTLYIDDLDVNGGNIEALVQSFDDSAETIKGTLYIVSVTDLTKKLVFNVTGAVTNAVGYSKVTVTCVQFSEINPFVNGTQVYAVFLRNGMGTNPATIQNQEYTYFSTGGTGGAYTLTPSPALAAYTTGQSFMVRFMSTNVAGATINISGLGAISLLKIRADGSYTALENGDVPSNHRSRVTVISGTQALVETLPIGIQTGTLLPTTAGTEVTWLSLPASAKEFVLSLSGTSMSGVDPLMVQLGDAGGFETTGYNGSVIAWTNAPANTVAALGGVAGIQLILSSAANLAAHGTIRFTQMDAATNLWAWFACFTSAGDGRNHMSSGTKQLTGTLDRIKLGTVSGVQSLDAGSASLTVKV